MVATEAEDAWCPPTLLLSGLGRTLLAWWMIWVESQSRRRSIDSRVASVSGSSPPRCGGTATATSAMRSIVALMREAPSASGAPVLRQRRVLSHGKSGGGADAQVESIRR